MTSKIMPWIAERSGQYIGRPRLYSLGDGSDDRTFYLAHTRLAVKLSPLNSSLPVFVDEIRYLFGLEKWGTLRGSWSGRRWIFYPLRSPPRYVPIDKLTPELIDEIRRFFVLRDMLGIRSHGKSIEISTRTLEGEERPLLRGRGESFSRSEVLMTNSVIQNWFQDTSPSQVLVRTLGIDPEAKEINARISSIRYDLFEVAQRVDPRLIVRIPRWLNRLLGRVKMAALERAGYRNLKRVCEQIAN